jgi:hypothetical protein
MHKVLRIADPAAAAASAGGGDPTRMEKFGHGAAGEAEGVMIIVELCSFGKGGVKSGKDMLWNWLCMAQGVGGVDQQRVIFERLFTCHSQQIATQVFHLRTTPQYFIKVD